MSMSNPESVGNLSFEEALNNLESIVETLEGGGIPLSELVSEYEKGTRLLEICRKRLGEAELRIEKVCKSQDGCVSEPMPELPASNHPTA